MNWLTSLHVKETVKGLVKNFSPCNAISKCRIAPYLTPRPLLFSLSWSEIPFDMENIQGLFRFFFTSKRDSGYLESWKKIFVIFLALERIIYILLC